MVEQLALNQLVVGSNPTGPIGFKSTLFLITIMDYSDNEILEIREGFEKLTGGIDIIISNYNHEKAKNLRERMEKYPTSFKEEVKRLDGIIKIMEENRPFKL